MSCSCPCLLTLPVWTSRLRAEHPTTTTKWLRDSLGCWPWIKISTWEITKTTAKSPSSWIHWGISVLIVAARCVPNWWRCLAHQRELCRFNFSIILSSLKKEWNAWFSPWEVIRRPLGWAPHLGRAHFFHPSHVGLHVAPHSGQTNSYCIWTVGIHVVSVCRSISRNIGWNIYHRVIDPRCAVLIFFFFFWKRKRDLEELVTKEDFRSVWLGLVRTSNQVGVKMVWG